MKFWLLSIVSGLMLIGLALALWLNQELLFSFSQDVADETVATKVDRHHDDKAETDGEADPVAKEEVIKAKKKTNAAADGLSRYYANLHGEMDGKGPKIRNNIVYLPDPEGDLEKILEARRLITRPLRKNWTGNTDSHPFRLGETLYQKLSEYANENDLEMIWWLNRDFLVKDAFRINENIITTSYQVGKAIEGHFENGLSIYFCYQQRAIVLIENSIPYLAKECMLLPKGSS
ncbi:TcpQ domain-containing protein [Colwellia sp. PAMC 21821]|uniref:TcpQ domain-containing protein n=1 Tax=Colwellia sp. PAMC 21821 TaxID=1816219 RepID=UPI0009C148D9|nr:TcpQ domain-containing protein [Colwellia sp. PAMC 21821]ARD45095.1 hypothetical protein A3Q33_12715 [Colwellia sp. PAMC 21821]